MSHLYGAQGVHWSLVRHCSLITMSVRAREKKTEEERQRLLNEKHPLDSVEPLDEEQQEKVVAELRATAKRQAASARRIFSILYKFIVCVFLFCFGYSNFYPWEIAHQSVFYGMVPLLVFHVYYVAMAIIFFIAALGISKGIMKTNRQMNYAAVGIAVVMTLMWFRYFWMWEVTAPSLYWLPLTPSACIGLAIYVDWDADNTIMSVDHLNDMKYTYKRV